MSESMPVVANTTAVSQIKDALSTGSTDTAAASGDFTELLDSQLQLAEENISAFPTELLSISEETELLTAVPPSGNDLPLTAANPETSATLAQASMTPLEIIQPQNSTAASLQASSQAAAVKPMAITDAASAGNKTNTTALTVDSGDAVNMDEMLMARQQQHLIQAAASSKDSTLFDSALSQQQVTESVSQPASTSSSHNNMMNVAGLSAGMATKTDGMPGVTPAPLSVPPQHAGWNQSVGERLQWMVGQNLQSADIRLDPPELGSMEVRIQINKDHASIVFSAPNAQVRDALESAIPRLREMMNEIGLSLGDVNVSQESFTQQQQADKEPEATGRAIVGDEPESGAEDAIALTTPQQGRGLLDAYA